MFNMYLHITPHAIARGFIIKSRILKFITVNTFINKENINKIDIGRIVKTPDITNIVEIFLNMSIEIGKVVIVQDRLNETEDKI